MEGNPLRIVHRVVDNRPSLQTVGAVLALGLIMLGGLAMPAAHATTSSLIDCTQTASTCTSNPCETVNGACVCVAGTNPVPAGCIVDNSVTCWNQSRAYTCYSSTPQQSCTSAQLQGCQLLKSTCTDTLSNGTCVSYDQTWACPDRAQTTCNPSQPGSNCALSSENCLDAVDGYCTDQQSVYGCSAPVPYCNTTPGCTFVSQTCASTINGVCAVEDQTYQCTTTTRTCAQYATSGACASVNTAGLQNQTSGPNNNAFGQAVDSMALLDAIKKNISNGNPPEVFSGNEGTCVQLWGCTLGSCCCSTQLKNGGSFIWSCSQEEINLAGYRRAGLAVNVANGCHDGIPNPFNGGCLACTGTIEYYCTFDNVLAKLVQVQGRAQLAALAAQGYAGATQTPLSYPFYAGTGGWFGPVDANGNDVWVYQWPAACNTATPPSGLACPEALQSTFATCDGTSCPAPAGVPPALPAAGPGAQPSGLDVQAVDVLSQDSTALSKYVVATPQAGNVAQGNAGGCNSQTNQCTYTLSAWPGGAGGTAMLQEPVSWPLYSQPSGWQGPQYLANYAFAGESLPLSQADSALPATVAFEYSTNNGTTFQTVSLPRTLPASSDYQLPGTQVTIYGGCPSNSAQCTYTVVAPATATAKPWVISEGQTGCTFQAQVDCSGFTLQQFELLDLSKMNLSGWVQSVTPTLPTQANVTQQTASQAGTLTPSQPGVPNTGNNETAVLRLNQSECQVNAAVNTCQMQAWLTSNWQTTYNQASANTNPVQSVSVNWGDGSAPGTATAPVYNSQSGTDLFALTHTYTAPGQYDVTATFTMPDGTVHTAQAQVQAYANTPPSNQNDQNAVGGPPIPGS